MMKTMTVVGSLNFIRLRTSSRYYSLSYWGSNKFRETEAVIATWSNRMKFRLSGWLLREGWHVDSEADDDAMEMTGIMIIGKNISALKQKLIHAKTNKNQLNFYLAATLGIGKWLLDKGWPLNRGLS